MPSGSTSAMSCISSDDVGERGREGIGGCGRDTGGWDDGGGRINGGGKGGIEREACSLKRRT